MAQKHKALLSFRDRRALSKHRIESDVYRIDDYFDLSKSSLLHLRLCFILLTQRYIMINPQTFRNLVRVIERLREKAIQAGHAGDLLNKCTLLESISSRKIGEFVDCSHQTVNRTASSLLAIYKKSPDIDLLNLSDNELMSLFYPKMMNKTMPKRRPPIALIINEAAKRPKKLGLKIKTIYLSYRAQDPSTALSISHFYFLVRQEIKQSKLEYLFEYKPGELICADYAGIKLIYYPESPQKPELLDVFVAVWGYSNRMFAVASKRHTTNDWVRGFVKAFTHFDACPCVVQFDNGEMVKKSGLVATLTEQAQCMAAHYDLMVDTSEIGSPRQNAKAEKGVQHISNRVLVLMRKLHFTTIDEVNAHLLAEVEKLNDEPLQKIKTSRNALFEEHEKPASKALPTYAYKPFDKRFTQTSSIGCTVTYANNLYSIPYKKRNLPVTIEIAGNTLTVFHNYDVIASHEVLSGVNQRRMLDAHKSPAHLAQSHKNKAHFMQWASAIDTSIANLVQRQYERVNSENSRPAGKACIYIQKLHKRYGDEALISACKYADTHVITQVQELELVLQTEIHSDNNETQATLVLPQHKNIRGAQYYGSN